MMAYPAQIEPDARTGWFEIKGQKGVRLAGNNVTCLLGITDCDDVVIEGLTFAVPGAGLRLRNCTNVQVVGCDFLGGSSGIGALLVRGVTISGCTFRDMPGDAIQLNTYGDVLIERNSFRDFRGEPLHRDCIQLIAADQTKPITNVVIRGNRIERGDGIPPQFIFLSDSAAGYDQVWVEGNAGIGSAFHGITINAPLRVTIENNFLQADARLWNGQLLVPWIKPMNPLPGAVVTVRNNAVMPATAAAAPGDRSALAAWLKTPVPAGDADALAAAQKAVTDALARIAAATAALTAP